MGQAGPMCGRYAASREPAALVEEFGVDVPPDVDLPARYNIAPTQEVYVVRDGKPDEPARGGFADPPGQTGHRPRRLDVARWGLVPSWAKDPAIGNRMINARAETVAEKPSYRRALGSRRCLLPADGFYEWQAVPEQALSAAGKKPPKQPYFLHPADGTGLAMAGLYEWWRDPAVDDAEDPRAWLLSTTIITTSARGEIGRIHDRMPVVVPVHQRDAWLDPGTPGAEVLQDLLSPTPEGFWDIYPVSTAVNSVRHQGPELVRPLPL
jgi:putative SOS response-associated peptidase YedK